jgi:hypothetical protein
MDQVLAKYKELYSLSKDAVAKELERMRRAEDKAAKYATLSALLVTLSALAGKDVLPLFIPPARIVDWVCITSFLLFIVILLYAFINILRTLRIVTIDIPGMNAETVDFFDKEEYIDIIYALARRNCEIIEKNSMVYHTKLQGLLRTYKALLLSLVFISSFVVSMVIWLSQKQ